MKLLEIILFSFAISFGLYGSVTLVLRGVEYRLMLKLSERKPDLKRFVLLHLGSVAVVSLFAPIMVYLVGGQIKVAMGFTSAEEFHGSMSFWISAYIISGAFPLQFHYTVNSRLMAFGDPPEPRPRWLPKLWTVFTFTAVALAWTPLWLGWLTLESFGF